MNKSIKILIKWIAGPLLAVWLFYSLYQQLRLQPDIGSSIAIIKTLPFGVDGWKFWMVIILVFINWGLEAWKWQLLMQVLQPMSFFAAFRSVLSGVTFSLNTPNRMGEFAGRILFVAEGKRIQAVSLSIAGGLAQLTVTMLMGCLGIIYFIYQAKNSASILDISVFWLHVFLYSSMVCTLVFIVFYFRMGWMTRLLEKLPFAGRFYKYMAVLDTFDAKTLLRLLSISCLRYIVFIVQYIFMLQILQVEQNAWIGFWIVTVMFWVLAIIPSFTIAELGIRGTVAQSMFGYSTNTLGILTATFGIWFVNLFIPALIGSLLILGFNLKKGK